MTKLTGWLCVILLATSACTAEPARAGHPSPTGSASAGAAAPAAPAPVATTLGDWSAEVEEARSRTRSTLDLKILADGKVTDAELSEAKSSFTTCMAGKGYSVEWADSSEEFSVGHLGTASPDQGAMDAQEDAVRECDAKGAAQSVSLYYRIHRNPGHLDEREIMAACLVRVGAVPAGYSATDYERDLMADPTPEYLDSALGLQCLRDPLGRNR
jgi:hypothetical protein